MKIVQIEDFFHPDAGYQGNVLSKYWAKDGHEIYMITSQLEKMPNTLTDFFGADHIEEKDKLFFEETGVKIIRMPIHKYISGRAIYTAEIFKVVDAIKPDILYVHGSDTYIGIRYALKSGKLKYPMVLDNHMLDMASKNKFNKIFYWFYRTFVTPKLVKNKTLILRVVEDEFIIKRHNVPREQSPVLGFGSDLLQFHKDNEKRKEIRLRLGILEEDFVVLYAGKLDESKGGKFLAESIKDEFKTNKRIIFLIIGNISKEYVEEIESLFNESQNKIIRLETQVYRNLSQYYQCADIALFPKQCSLSYYDVQACGLPVVLENNTINVNRIDHNNGVCFLSENIEDMRTKIEYMANLSEEDYRNMSSASISFIEKNFNYENIVKKYNEILEQEVQKFK